jgi:hypothetical protein
MPKASQSASNECGNNCDTHQGESKHCSVTKGQSKVDSNARSITESDQRVWLLNKVRASAAATDPRRTRMPKASKRATKECSNNRDIDEGKSVLAQVQVKTQSGLERANRRREPPKSAAPTATPTKARASAAPSSSTNPRRTQMPDVSQRATKEWPQQ